MSEAHRIRLLGPWQVAPLENLDKSAVLPPPARMTVPCSWRDGGWQGFRGRALHSRSFGRPTGLGPNERVNLVIEPLAGAGEIRLNGQLLGTIAANTALVCDVSGRLEPRNLLEIELAAEGDWGGVTGEVRLEIFHRLTEDEAAEKKSEPGRDRVRLV